MSKANEVEKGERLFSMHFRQAGESIDVSTKFHKQISGRELLNTLGLGVKGMIESMMKIGREFGLTDDQVLEVALGSAKSSGGDYEESDEGEDEA